MKYLFIIGNPSDFETIPFRAFLDHIIKMDGGKPFKLFLHKFKSEYL